MITIPRVAELALTHRVFFVQPSASGHVVAGSPEGRVSLVGPDLTLAGHFDFGRKPNDVAISPAGDVLAICADDSLSLVRASDGREHLRVPVGPGCASAFGDDGALVWTLRSAGDEVTVQLRDARDGRVLRETSFAAPVSDLICSFHPQPRRGGVAVWAAAGQDGQWIFWADDTGDAIVIARAEEISDCIPPCFDADGSAFLISSFDSVSRWSFPESECLGSIDEWPWSETEEDCLGTSVAWADAHRALVTTNENRLYLVDMENACVVGEAVIEGHPLRPIGELYPRLKDEGGLTTDLQFLVPVKQKNRLISVHGDLESARLVLSNTTALAQ